MQYRDEIIEVREHDGMFLCRELEIYNVETYAQICAKIDHIKTKEKEVVKRIPVFKLSDNKQGVVRGTAGAREKARYASGFEYWVSWDNPSKYDKKREKANDSRLILNTPENMAVAEKIFDIQKRIVDLGIEQDALEEQLVTLATAPAPEQQP